MARIRLVLVSRETYYTPWTTILLSFPILHIILYIHVFFFIHLTIIIRSHMISISCIKWRVNNYIRHMFIIYIFQYFCESFMIHMHFSFVYILFLSIYILFVPHEQFWIWGYRFCHRLFEWRLTGVCLEVPSALFAIYLWKHTSWVLRSNHFVLAHFI